MAEAKKIRVAVISTGSRAVSVVKHLLEDSNRQVEIAAVYDPDKSEMAYAKGKWESPETKECSSSAEAIAAPGVEWVMVFSPNATHKQYILEAFAAGKHVFSEKPLATSIQDCIEIYDAYRKSGLRFATGFVLRYSPVYRRVRELLDSGKFGKIISIDANENITPSHGSYIMMNWRRHTALAGPHILEKCCHDLDLINWFVGSKVTRGASFGGKNFFLPENDGLRAKYPGKTFLGWRDPHAIATPFNDDNDLMDNQTSIFEYRNQVRVQFQCTMSNAIPERRMYFSCSEGTIEVELYAGTVRWKTLGVPERHEVNFKCDGHGGGDEFIMKELFATMTTGVPPKCSGDEGLESAVVAMGLDTAAKTGQVFDYEPIWKQLGR